MSSPADNKLDEDVYASEYTIKKWVDKITGKTRTRRIRPNRITFANNLLQGIKPTSELAAAGSPYLYVPEKIKKSPTAKLVLSRERAKARKDRAAEARGEKVKPMKEELNPKMGAGEYIKDFRKSNAPQFKGKSKSKRTEMAIAAYMADKTKNEEVENTNMSALQELATEAYQLSLEHDAQFHICLDEQTDEIYISEEQSDLVIGTYVQGDLYIDEESNILDEGVLAELNYDTLKSYSKKANADLNKKLGDIARTRKDDVKTADKISNRIKGLGKAEERMNKKVEEQVETDKNFMLEHLQTLAEQAIQDSIETGQAVFVCVDEQDELYLSEDFSDDVIATYIDGEVYISDEDAEYIQENVALALAGQLFE